jgi:hypothetical protein
MCWSWRRLEPQDGATMSTPRDEDCDSGQGFLFARPLDVAATEAFMQRGAGKSAVTLRWTL